MERSSEYEEEFLEPSFDPQGETGIVRFLQRSGSRVRITYTPDQRLKYTVYKAGHWDMSTNSLGNAVTRVKGFYEPDLEWVHPKWKRAVDRYL